MHNITPCSSASIPLSRSLNRKRHLSLHRLLKSPRTLQTSDRRVNRLERCRRRPKCLRHRSSHSPSEIPLYRGFLTVSSRLPSTYQPPYHSPFPSRLSTPGLTCNRLKLLVITSDPYTDSGSHHPCSTVKHRHYLHPPAPVVSSPSCVTRPSSPYATRPPAYQTPRQYVRYSRRCCRPPPLIHCT